MADFRFMFSPIDEDTQVINFLREACKQKNVIIDQPQTQIGELQKQLSDLQSKPTGA
jgi:hypothetical protein